MASACPLLLVCRVLYPLRVLVFCSLSPTGMVANDTGDTGSLKSQRLGSLASDFSLRSLGLSGTFSYLLPFTPSISLFLFL